MKRVTRRALLLTMTLSGLAAVASAGITDIGQPKSFPIVISRPGSYRLTSNLVVPDGVDAIDVNAPDVTLDLNGFTVRGPQTCTGDGITLVCSGGSGGSGIIAGERNVTVRNGTVKGFIGNGLSLASGSRMEDVTVAESGGVSVTSGTVSNCIINRNNATIALYASHSQLRGTTANGNRSHAFWLVLSSATDSVAEGNGGAGFLSDGSSRSLVSNSSAFDNGFGDLVGVVSPGNNACTNGPC